MQIGTCQSDRLVDWNRMEKYLVTGGAGFIGSHLVGHILDQGGAAVVLDDFSSGRRDNLSAFKGDLSVIEGSICDPAAIAKAIDGVDGIIHLAAVPSVARSVEDPVSSHLNNATGTVHVLDAARQAGIKVVYAGSSSAYGDQEVGIDQEALRENPMSPYASAKLAGELYCRSFARVYGLSVVVTRFFNVFGPRQVPDSPYSGVIAAYCFALLKGQTPIVHGDGQQSRDFTYVGDVVRGCMLAMRAQFEGCQTFNLACGGTHTVLDILNGLGKHAGVKAEPAFQEGRKGDVRHSQADVTRARELLGFEPQVTLEQGLKHTYDWYRSNYA